MPTLANPIALVSAAFLLGSCVLGPQPGSPDYTTPDSVRGDSGPHGASFGDRAWRQVFTDATLKSLIETALKNNPDMVAATYRIEEARALAGVARADWFPTLDGAADAVARGTGKGGDHSDSYSVSGFLSWEIDLWGGIRRSNEAARARELQAQHQRDAVQTSLVAAVAGAYIELKSLDERLEISKRTAESRQKSLDLVLERRNGGVSSDLEVGQAEALLGQARTAIPVTEQAIAAKENEIRSLLGEFPGSVARGGSLDSLESRLRIKAGLPSELLQRRPDIAAADQAFQAATAEIGVAQALRLPRLALTGSGGWASTDLDQLLERKSGVYSIGPDLAGPIFDAGRGKSRVMAAQARAKQALADHDRAAKQAFREAADAINAHMKTGQIVTEQSRLVESERKVATVANERFLGGASSYLEVLDAERNLFDSELQLADARRDRLLSVVQAYRALGGGWK